MSDEKKAGGKASRKAKSEETPPEKPSTQRLRYLGRADVFRHKEHSFRNGQPVEVPSDVAEELLTTPFERFEVVKE